MLGKPEIVPAAVGGPKDRCDLGALVARSQRQMYQLKGTSQDKIFNFCKYENIMGLKI